MILLHFSVSTAYFLEQGRFTTIRLIRRKLLLLLLLASAKCRMFAKFHHMIAWWRGYLVFNQGMVVMSHQARHWGARWIAEPFRQSTCLVTFEWFVVLGFEDPHLDMTSAMGRLRLFCGLNFGMQIFLCMMCLCRCFQVDDASLFTFSLYVMHGCFTTNGCRRWSLLRVVLLYRLLLLVLYYHISIYKGMMISGLIIHDIVEQIVYSCVHHWLLRVFTSFDTTSSSGCITSWLKWPFHHEFVEGLPWVGRYNARSQRILLSIILELIVMLATVLGLVV